MKRTDAFHCERTRYHYDLKLTADKGWKQYDTNQDFAYFGIWVNDETLQVMTFAEGDETLQTCENDAEFQTLLAKMAKFHGAAPPVAKVITAEGIIISLHETASHGRPAYTETSRVQ
jgi:hypothetical protein